MLALLALFLTAMLLGSRSEKPGFWEVACLMLVVFFGLCFMWQDENLWPGLLTSAFVAQVGQWVIAMVIGLMVGGLIFGNGWKKKKT